jgi:hypothetical protein
MERSTGFPFLLATWLAATTPLFAQDVRVKVAAQKPPYYIGEPVLLQFNVEGFDEQPEPSCAMDQKKPVPGLRGQLAGANPSVFSQIVQRNGRVYQAKTITYRLDYLVTADQPGDYLVGPFVIKQGNRQARVDAVQMTFESVPEDPNMRVRLVLPDKPVYPDQRVPVGIEWWYAGDFDEILKLRIHSPLFDKFHFAPDPEPTRRTSRLPIDTKDGQLQLVAEAREEEYEGRLFTVVSATRTLIPDRVGEFPLDPITATLRKATAWARERSVFDDFDDFGFGDSLFRDMIGERRRPTRTALIRAVGEPQTLAVKPFPIDGRPESFAGAVGDGFSIDVAADRTVVRVGDPIALNITLRGQGNIENASLPPLSADGGMNPDLFRLPQGDVTGTISEGAKQFRVSVRVSDESVAEIPALAFSWFDPETETYETARSKPIALRVMPTKLISAKDVVSGSSKSPVDTVGNGTEDDESNEVAVATGRQPVFSLSGADLAIESDAGLVLRDSGARTAGVVTQMAIYVIGLLLIAVALVDRRRRNVDPALVARRKNVRQQKTRIARAASLPRQRAADEIAGAVRALVADFPDVARDDAAAVTAECESIVYAPAGSAEARLDNALLDKANEVASRYEQAAFSNRA